MWPPPKGLYLDTDFNLHYPPDARHGDDLDEDMKEFLDPHWTQFPPQNPIVNVFVGVAFVILLIFSIMGNGCIIYIFLKAQKLRTPSNVFVISLAIGDLSMMLTHGLPVGVNAFVQRHWMYGPLNCKLFSALGGTTGTVAIMSMVLIGYDRCNIIAGGIAAKRLTRSKAVMMCLFLWVYAALSSTGPFFGWGQYGLEGIFVTCSYDYIKKDWNSRSYVLYILITHFFIPMTFVIYFYSRITRAVISHERELKKQAAKMGVESLKQKKDGEESVEVKIAKVAITNILLWICTWCPYAIVVMIGLAGQYHLLTPMVVGMPSLLIKTTSSLNPLVFAFAHPSYREALATELPWLGIGRKPEPKGDTRTEAVTAT